MKLKKLNISRLPKDITDFSAINCMDCNFNGIIPTEYFLVISPVKSDKEENQLAEYIKKELGYESYFICDSHLGMIVCLSKCPKCGSENIFRDY